MSPVRTLDNIKYETGDNRTPDPSFGGYMALPTRQQSQR